MHACKKFPEMEGVIQAIFYGKIQQWLMVAYTYFKIGKSLKIIQCLKFSGDLALKILLETYYDEAWCQELQWYKNEYDAICALMR